MSHLEQYVSSNSSNFNSKHKWNNLRVSSVKSVMTSLMTHFLWRHQHSNTDGDSYDVIIFTLRSSKFSIGVQLSSNNQFHSFDESWADRWRHHPYRPARWWRHHPRLRWRHHEKLNVQFLLLLTVYFAAFDLDPFLLTWPKWPQMTSRGHITFLRCHVIKLVVSYYTDIYYYIAELIHVLIYKQSRDPTRNHVTPLSTVTHVTPLTHNYDS